MYLQSGGLNLELLYNPLQLERVGLAQTGFFRTNQPAPAGLCWSQTLTFSVSAGPATLMLDIADLATVGADLATVGASSLSRADLRKGTSSSLSSRASLLGRFLCPESAKVNKYRKLDPARLSRPGK
jgi:hypothetical protein